MPKRGKGTRKSRANDADDDVNIEEKMKNLTAGDGDDIKEVYLFDVWTRVKKHSWHLTMSLIIRMIWVLPYGREVRTH